MELTRLKYISEKRAAEFNKLGIFSVEDLIRFYPKSYLDLTKQSTLSEAYHNDMALCRVRVITPPAVSPRRGGGVIRCMCLNGDDTFSAVWFNAPYVAGKLTVGEYLFYGRVRREFGAVSMVNPTFEPIDKNYNLKGIVPVYNLKGLIPQKTVRTAVREALFTIQTETAIPKYLCERHQLSSMVKALYDVHNPKTFSDVKRASERIALEEYFALLSAFKVIKGSKQDARVNKYDCSRSELDAFCARFGFEFTNGQKKAVEDIYGNMFSPVKMNRLLQGDVGCGKTAVAFCGVYIAVKSGYQAAVLAPTEVLAKQNFNLLEKYFPEYNCAYLSGGATVKEKKLIKQKIADGQADIICGTHAIIQPDVEYARLAFCVCDEQQRFGVAQRSSFNEKGVSCDTLIMSATPIPRTLSLIFYGDLDVTTITDRPKLRAQINTRLLSESKYEDMLAYIGKQVALGRQAYFVCPKIDEEGDVTSVKELYAELSVKLPNVRFALMHGKLKDKEKTDIMLAFKNGEYDCLVSTTVIEVGIDVPNATIMVIYNSERFGLSQLHQLRGRVGRGEQESYCFMLCSKPTDEALERLSVLKSTSDGFKISEYDLQMRGGGDFLGTRQSGKILKDIQNLNYPPEVIFTAKAICDEAFARPENIPSLTVFARKKYDSLKDIVLN